MRGRRLLTLCCLCMFLCCPGRAELVWPESVIQTTPALVEYIEQVNLALRRAGSREINSYFECYESFATLGITQMDMADSAEDVEIILQMHDGILDQAEIRTCNLDEMPLLVAAMAAIASGEPWDTDLKPYLGYPQALLKQIRDNPTTTITPETVPDKGDQLRIYGFYEPNALGDGTNWAGAVLVFPRKDDYQPGIMVTPPPETSHETVHDGSDDDADYTPYDDGTHLEVFVTATPEPDSAAAESF